MKRGARTYNRGLGQSPHWCPGAWAQGRNPWSWKLFCICTTWGVGHATCPKICFFL